MANSKRLVRRLAKKMIQAMGAEGSIEKIELESLLTRAMTGIEGVRNAYMTYGTQTQAIYRKYNAEDTFGNEQVRTLVDTRTAFIGGAGMSVSCEDKKTSDFFDEVLRVNKLRGSRFFNLVKGTEMKGRIIVMIRPDPGNVPKLSLMTLRYDDKVVLTDPDDVTSVVEVLRKNNVGDYESIPVKNAVYIRTGGDDESVNDPTTKIGICLTSCENYDRALKDMRLLNYVLARITPTFKTENKGDAEDLYNQLSQMKWKIGRAYAGTAKFSYETVGTGAHENLKSEASTCIKTISGVTGMPVHWIGWVDLMSNRSTADSLQQFVENATSMERAVISDCMYELFIKIQNIYIDTGGTMISKVNNDFDIKIPLIDNNNILERVRALNIAFGDKAISLDTYRDSLPGVDPLREKELVEAEQEKATEDLMSFQVNNTEEDDGGEDETGDAEGTEAKEQQQSKTIPA